METVPRQMGLPASGRVSGLILVAVLASMAASCGEREPMPAKYPASSCARLEIADAATGAAVTGAEDFALDWTGRRLFVSAYDRNAVEAAVDGEAPPPAGGIYAISFDALAPGARVRAENIAADAPFARDFRPHGISLAYVDGAVEIAAIERSYKRAAAHKRWRVAPQLALFRETAHGFTPQPGTGSPLHCHANDLEMLDARSFIVSYDHEACNWRAALEDIFGLKRSGAYELRMRDEWRTQIDVAAHAGIANGIAGAGKDAFFLAATREKRVRFYADLSGVPVKSFKTPGGPDNLTVAPDGAVIAAVHPNLLRIFLLRRLGFAHAPSRVVRLDPKTGADEILFDDPSGKVFTAATVAAEIDGKLVMGSVTDAGLLVCKAPDTDEVS